jgi:hypothetical protein
MGVPLTPVTIKRFADGEIYVQILESIRGALLPRRVTLPAFGCTLRVASSALICV